MERDFRSYLEDLQLHLGRLHALCTNRSAQDFEANFELFWAVERGFEIVGEILRRMTLMVPDTMVRIDAVGKIIGFRNLLAHEYDRIEEQRVWMITQQNLPRLMEQVNQWAAELGMESPPTPAQSIKTAS